jgi:hypothetical protein
MAESALEDVNTEITEGTGEYFGDVGTEVTEGTEISRYANEPMR